MTGSNLYLSAILLSAIACQRCYGFVPRSTFLEHRKSMATVLFYTDDPPKQDNLLKKRRVLTIPVLGPIPGGTPLVVGEDFVVDNPTPLQWQALEESMYNHREYLKEEAQKSNDNDEASSTAGIDAAPLVAFMDDVTSLAPIPGDKRNAKYATIAAVVGISSSEKKSRDPIDTSSTSSFMESLMRVFKPDVKVLANSKIRLVGIGRAALSDFYSRMPSDHYESTRDSYLQIDTSSNSDSDSDNNDDPIITPVMMAQFRLLSDAGERSAHFTRYGRASNSSPVHALNEMSNFANRITALHEDRKRLVRGLKAAKARLAVVSNDDEVVLEDHDGLGQLSSGFNDNTEDARDQTQQDIQTLLSDFPGTTDFPSSHSGTCGAHARVLEMKNYGLGETSASFSQIPGLTRALEEKLQPYYSPEKQASEEHYYEIFSFMGVLSLNKFVQPKDLDWTLKCTNTIERMEWVYEHMWMHKKLLRDASEEVSEELRDCGEECTDLW